MKKGRISAARKALAIAVVLTTAFLCAWPMRSAASASSSQDQTLGLHARPVLTLQLPQLFPLGGQTDAPDKERLLIPGGQAVGVAIRTQGVLVVGAGDSGSRALREGDMILSVNGVPLLESDMLTEAVNAAQGQPLSLRILRNGQESDLLITPSYDESSRAWRLGIWVRDSTAGVGTLTYYDSETGTYGALGHAITDSDTGSLLPVRQGALMQASIVDVHKGQRGTPGELRGSFLREQLMLGTVARNTPFGIYGQMTQAPSNPLYPDGLPVASRSEVHTGEATILSTISGQEMQQYTVEITQVSRQSTAGQKSMVLHVTDERLLSATGGIVQGMSGSPIIQDGKLVGAVTHVLVNDPARGYGIFIENMLDAAG